jgi:hypothetical protein
MANGLCEVCFLGRRSAHPKLSGVSRRAIQTKFADSSWGLLASMGLTAGKMPGVCRLLWFSKTTWNNKLVCETLAP